MKISDIKQAKEIFKAESISGKQLTISSKTEIVHLSIGSKKSIAKHSIPQKIYFYVISGKGFFEINEEKHIVEKGNLIECPPNIPRSWQNTENSVLELIAVKEL